jgi:phage-related protein
MDFQKMKFKVEFVELENDEKPFLEFVLHLTIKERAKIFETINFFLELKNRNLPIKENLSKHLDDGIFELRISLRDKIARTLYYYQKGAKIIITHGFIKKSQKTPEKEITKAKRLRKIFNRRIYND